MIFLVRADFFDRLDAVALVVDLCLKVFFAGFLNLFFNIVLFLNELLNLTVSELLDWLL